MQTLGRFHRVGFSPTRIKVTVERTCHLSPQTLSWLLLALTLVYHT